MYLTHEEKLENMNREFDTLKMNRDYEGMVLFLKMNEAFFLDNGWKLDKMINDLETILKLEKGL